MSRSASDDNIVIQASATIGSAPTSTTYSITALPTFLDSTALGYHFVECSNVVQVGDWLQLSIIKTNGFQATFAVTNGVSGQLIENFLQPLMDQINDDPDFQSADGVNANDMISATNGFPQDASVHANSPGWPAAQISTVFSGSPDLVAFPPGTYSLTDNVRDCSTLGPQPKLRLNSFSAPFSLDTTKFCRRIP